MVIFSSLLFGQIVPATASLESVLAPVWVGADGSEAPLPDMEYEAGAEAQAEAEPLVQAGADSLDLLAELERQMTEKLQPAGHLRLIPVSRLPDPPRRAALPELVIVDHPPRLTSSLMFIRFRLVENGVAIASYAMTFRAQVNAEVWVPSRRLAPGEALTPADFTTREVDLAREPKAVPIEKVALKNYELARAVAPERPLVWSDLAPRALVRKGDLVNVVGDQGLLSVSMKGQATRSGGKGEFVTIRNLESKRDFSAEVIDENKVRVHF